VVAQNAGNAVKRATEALVHEAQTRTRDAQGNAGSQDDAEAAGVVTVSGSKMVTGMAQVSYALCRICSNERKECQY